MSSLTVPLPQDSNSVPYLANADSNGGLAVPVEQWIKSGSLYVPVSATAPLPVVTQQNSAYPTGITPLAGYAQTAANTALSLPIPALAGKFANISNITLSFNVASLTGVNFYISPITTGGAFNCQIPINTLLPITLNFNPPIQAATINEILTLATSTGLGAGVAIGCGYVGYYSTT
jgi:hypothetical protein